MLENVGNPFGVLNVGFLTANGFDVFRVSKDDTARRFENVENGNPILAGRLHTNVMAVVVRQPSGEKF